MKKKLKLDKKTVKNLKLKLKETSDRKQAPLYVAPIYEDDNPTNGMSC